MSQRSLASRALVPDISGDETAATLWSTFAPALAGGPRVRLGVRRAHGRVEYPNAHERSLTEALPTVPAAVRVYGADGCCVALHLDFDAKGAHSPASATRAHDQVVHLLAVLGMRWISDIAPTGGRHIYLPLDFRLPFDDARDIVEGLAHRFPSLDAGPHQSAMTGCIRPPGAVHASGGHQRLTMPLQTALAALERPNSAAEVEELRAAIAGDVALVRERRISAATVPLDVDVTRIAPPSPISARLLSTARHGTWDRERYGEDRSAARQAVIAGCVAAQWMVSDVMQRITDGTWPGLASMYAKYPTPGAKRRAVQRDFANAQRYLAVHVKQTGTPGEGCVRKSNTSAPHTRGVLRKGDDHGYVRLWRAALFALEAGRFPGRKWYAGRFVLRAIAEAAHKSGSRHVAFGCRSLAEASGLDHSTVSVLLKQIEGHGWIAKTQRGWGEKADTYELTLPDDVAELALDFGWPSGKIHSLRPAFRSLGHVSALVFEAVEMSKAETITELVHRLSMARSSVSEAVDLLLSWRLLERAAGRLTAHPERLGRVAEYLGVDVDVYAQMMKHRQQRALWRAWLARFESNEYLELAGLSDGWPLSPGATEIEAA